MLHESVPLSKKCLPIIITFGSGIVDITIPKCDTVRCLSFSKVLSAYKKVAGKWKIFINIWNSNTKK